LSPDDVRILGEGKGVLLAWEGRSAGWLRFLFSGEAASAPPSEFSPLHMDWQQIGPGVYVGIVEHH
jgi:hypothetical protein